MLIFTSSLVIMLIVNAL